MNVELQKKYKVMEKERSRKKKWRIAAISLCAVIAIGTSYILINPAATQVQETYCGFEEHVEHVDDCYEKVLVCQLPEEGHTHSETCYEEQQVLTCLLPETDGHTHSEDCYVTEEYLSCNKEETEGHQHGESCYAIERVLTCTSADEEHEHTEECYADKAVLVCMLEECEAHQHDESCFSQRTVITCTKEESPAHHHDTACYTTQTVCTCGMEESEPHQHTEACYAPDYEQLICQLPIHEHTLQCFSNPEADLEDASVWERSFENVKLSGNLNEDIIAVAETQIGYAESTTNYQVQEDGVSVKGYTRYGAWYGDPYGDWCAMFCSFCLNYAGVDRTLVPQESGCTRWVEKLASLEMLRDPAAYAPKPGDLVFFDWENYDPEHPETRQADHVGFVGELIYDESANAYTKIKTIEGNWNDCVCSNVYNLSESTILCYAEIPENTEGIIRTIESQPASDGAVAVITGRLPENAVAEIQAVPLSEEELVEYFGEDMAITMTGYVAYDIKIMVDGVEWQPDNSVVVTVRQPELDLETPDDLSLAHVKDETKDVQDIEVQKDEESGISFETDGFSMYIVYTHTRNENRVDDETGVMVECNGTTLLVQELGDNEKLDELRVDSYQAYGINTHRLLVRGRRIENAEQAVLVNITAEAVQIEPLLVCAVMAIPALLFVLMFSVFSRKKSLAKIRKELSLDKPRYY